jgi:hypothetical protein
MPIRIKEFWMQVYAGIVVGICTFPNTPPPAAHVYTQGRSIVSPRRRSMPDAISHQHSHAVYTWFVVNVKQEWLNSECPMHVSLGFEYWWTGVHDGPPWSWSVSSPSRYQSVLKHRPIPGIRGVISFPLQQFPGVECDWSLHSFLAQHSTDAPFWGVRLENKRFFLIWTSQNGFVAQFSPQRVEVSLRLWCPLNGVWFFVWSDGPAHFGLLKLNPTPSYLMSEVVSFLHG